MGRKKLERDRALVRVAASTPEKLKQMAYNLGYVYDLEGATGQLRAGDRIIIPRNHCPTARKVKFSQKISQKSLTKYFSKWLLL